MGKHCGDNWLPKPGGRGGGGVSREKGGDISRVKTETRGQRQEITEQKRRLKPKRQHLRKERKKKRGGGAVQGPDSTKWPGVMGTTGFSMATTLIRADLTT